MSRTRCGILHAAPQIRGGFHRMFGIEDQQVGVIAERGETSEPGDFRWIEFRVRVALYRDLRRAQHRARLDEKPTQFPQADMLTQSVAIGALTACVWP